MKPVTMDEIRETTVVKNANALLQKGWCVLKIFLQRKGNIDIICYVMGRNVKYCDIVPKNGMDGDKDGKSAETGENERI